MAQRDHLRDALVGVAAGAVGTLVMEQFFRALSALQSENGGADDDEGSDGGADEAHALDDISLTDIESREGESAPATLARAGYEALTGEEPSKELRNRLATGAHWGMGLSMGMIYGLARGRRNGGLDLLGGAAFGAAVWASADELAVPLLGLSAGPTAHPPSAHLKGLGAHLVYGAATAATAQAIGRLV